LCYFYAWEDLYSRSVATQSGAGAGVRRSD